MGRKGFTLVELLATIVIMSLVLGITSYSVIGIINTSKEKSEKIFVDKIGVAIEQYIALDGSKLIKDGTSYTFEKCKTSSCNDKKEVQADEVFDGSLGEYVNLSVLIEKNFFDDNKLVNPVNKKNCLVNKDPEIRIFKDSDYVYYYYVDLSGGNTSCEISDENGILHTLPDGLKREVGL